MEYIREGSATAEIDEGRAAELVRSLLERLRQRGPLRRVLLLPPDVTRLHSWAGFLTSSLYEQLRGDATVAVLPATGTHEPMTAAEIEHMYAGVPRSLFHAHDWRHGVVPLGEVPSAFVQEVSAGRLDYPIRVEVDRLLVEGQWDAIISVGQLVPHEVAGIANHAKNVFVGAGGSDLINKTHWLGAVHGIEQTLGRARTPVRTVLDYAGDRLAKHLPLVYLLTVRGRAADGRLVTRGLFAGDDTACFHSGADLCRSVNLDVLDRAQGGRVSRPAGVQVHLAGQQGDLSDAAGGRGRRRTGGAGAGRADVRRGPDHRPAHPPLRLPRRGGDAGAGAARAGAGRQPVGGGAPDSRLDGGALHGHVLPGTPEP